MKAGAITALLALSVLASGVEVGLALTEAGLGSHAGSHASLHAARPAPRNSLFQLATRWTSADDAQVTLADQRGKFQVLALVFTRCPSICPTLVKDLQRVEQGLPAEARDRTKFVLVSIDPEHDTPEALRAYRAKMGLDPEHWLLLHGSADEVRELSATLGASYGAGPGQALTHSRLITLLGPSGEILHQRVGLGEPGTLLDLIQTTNTPS